RPEAASAAGSPGHGARLQSGPGRGPEWTRGRGAEGRGRLAGEEERSGFAVGVGAGHSGARGPGVAGERGGAASGGGERNGQGGLRGVVRLRRRAEDRGGRSTQAGGRAKGAQRAALRFVGQAAGGYAGA